ncbi:MAG: heavy metal translocating P-type ATPase [Atribacterota bacterium]|nr:heavy metal translocating P-type ATPase [Atribacterota bacterium]
MEEKKEKTNHNLTIPILGMKCAACASRVEKGLEAIPGIHSVDVNLALSKATINYDSKKTNFQDIINEISKIGYEVPEEEIELLIEGMSCASCATRIEKKLNTLAGVKKAAVNLASNKAYIQFVPGIINQAEIEEAIESLGYGVQTTSRVLSEKRKGRKQNRENWQKIRFFVALFLSLPLFYMMVANWTGKGQFIIDPWIQLLLATPVQFFSGWPFYRGAYYSLKSGSASMDVLVALGTSVAYFYSLISLVAGWGVFYFESSAMLITIILLGKLLEERAKWKASEAVEKLVKLQPQTAHVLQNGIEKDIPAERIKVGDMVVVKPGECIPVDGVIVEGSSTVDESLLTGESMPVEKHPGCEVIGGSINQEGSFIFRATKVGADMALARIIKMVEEAQSSKAPLERLADRVSAIFVPTIIVLSVITFLGWYIEGAGFADSLMHMVTVLVVACPCALGLATPTAVMVGIGLGAEKGIFFRGGEYLEGIEKVDTVLLDKTGTITWGTPSVDDFFVPSSFDINETWAIISSGEKWSEHPLGQAIAKYGEKLDISPNGKIKNFNALPGKGVRFQYQDEVWYIGKEELLEPQGIDLMEVAEYKSRWEREGKTVVVAASGGKVRAIIALTDTIKDEARKVISELKQMGLEVVMVTGDQEVVAQAIAQKAGIDKVFSGVMPDEKVEIVKKLKEEGRTVAMVGDGINDAPALAQADVGIAIGTGTDIAIESADVILMNGELKSLLSALRLSRFTRRKIKQNLIWAFIYNLVTVPLAMFGIFTPIMGGVAMALSSTSVVANSLLLKRYRNKI